MTNNLSTVTIHIIRDAFIFNLVFTWVKFSKVQKIRITTEDLAVEVGPNPQVDRDDNCEYRLQLAVQSNTNASVTCLSII